MDWRPPAAHRISKKLPSQSCSACFSDTSRTLHGKNRTGITYRPTLCFCFAGAGGGSCSTEKAYTGAQGARDWRSTPPRRATRLPWRNWTNGRGWTHSGAPQGHRYRCTGLLSSLLTWRAHPPARFPPSCYWQKPSASLIRCLGPGPGSSDDQALAWTKCIDPHPVNGGGGVDQNGVPVAALLARSARKIATVSASNTSCLPGGFSACRKPLGECQTHVAPTPPLSIPEPSGYSMTRCSNSLGVWSAPALLSVTNSPGN